MSSATRDLPAKRNELMTKEAPSCKSRKVGYPGAANADYCR